MAAIERKGLVLDDTIAVVMDVLEDRPEISYPVLKEISKRVSGMDDREAKRLRIFELADELHGNVETPPSVS